MGIIYIFFFCFVARERWPANREQDMLPPEEMGRGGEGEGVYCGKMIGCAKFFFLLACFGLGAQV